MVQVTSACHAQAVALVFDHISLDCEELQPPPSSPGSQAPAATSSGSANAALKLLGDLCLMASGMDGPCHVQVSRHSCFGGIPSVQSLAGMTTTCCVHVSRLGVRVAAVAHPAKVVRAGAAGLCARGQRAHLSDCCHF